MSDTMMPGPNRTLNRHPLVSKTCPKDHVAEEIRNDFQAGVRVLCGDDELGKAEWDARSSMDRSDDIRIVILRSMREHEETYATKRLEAYHTLVVKMMDPDWTGAPPYGSVGPWVDLFDEVSKEVRGE